MDWRKINIKPKAMRSFSAPKKLLARKRFTSKPIVRENQSEEKGRNEMDSSPSTPSNSSTGFVVEEDDSTIERIQISEDDSTIERIQISEDAESDMEDDDGWVTDSVEKMRSEELLSWNESVIPPHISFRDSELVDVVFPHHTKGPIACSTPRALSDGRNTPLSESFAISSVSSGNEFVEKRGTLKDEDSQLKSISPKENLKLPDIPEDVIRECAEEPEDMDFELKSISPEQKIHLASIPADVDNDSLEQREDSFGHSDVPSSDGFKISEVLDETTKISNEDDKEYSKSNNFTFKYINVSINTDSKRRKQEDNVGNSSKSMDYKNGDNFEESLNIQIDFSKKKGRNRKEYNRMNESIIRWKKKNERRNLFDRMSYGEENFENVQEIQNKEFQEDDQIRSKVGADYTREKDVSILRRSPCSTSLRRKHRNERGNSSEDTNGNDSDDSSENVQNEELQDYEQDDNQQETAAHQRKTNNLAKFVSIQSRSNSEKNQLLNKIRNLLEDENDYNKADNFQHETPKRKGTPSRRVKLKYTNCINTPPRRKQTNEGANLFEDVDKTGNNSFGNTQNMHEELDSSQPEIVTHEMNRKINKHVEVDEIIQHEASISNISQSSTSLIKKHRNEAENMFEDMDTSNNEKGIENVQKNQNDGDKVGNFSEGNYNAENNLEKAENMQINTSKKKKRLYRVTGVKRKRRGNRSRKATNSLRRSKNSTGREASEGVQDNQNEIEKINWPRCCIGVSDFEETFPVLKPVLRDGAIDSITLVNLGVENMRKCKH